MYFFINFYPFERKMVLKIYSFEKKKKWLLKKERKCDLEK